MDKTVHGLIYQCVIASGKFNMIAKEVGARWMSFGNSVKPMSHYS